MPSLIVKPETHLDYYVVWSSVVDNATLAGTRAILQSTTPHSYGDAFFADERFDRADQYGSSAHPDGEMAGELWWDYKGVIVGNDPRRPGQWWLPRNKMLAYVRDDDLSVLRPLEG